jgi:hypothetical protein
LGERRIRVQAWDGYCLQASLSMHNQLSRDQRVSPDLGIRLPQDEFMPSSGDWLNVAFDGRSSRDLPKFQLGDLTMRHILGAAVAAATICGMAMSSALAEPVHTAGGPLQESGFCWTSTNGDQGYGYWHECEPTLQEGHRKKK